MCKVSFPSLVRAFIFSFFFLILDVTCNPEVYENTKVIINNTKCNGITTYECEHGYCLVQGNLQRTCLTGKRWSGLPPVCERKSVILHNNTVDNYVYKVRRHILLLNICIVHCLYFISNIVVWSKR